MCLREHVGVKAPGIAVMTTVPSLNSSAKSSGFGAPAFKTSECSLSYGTYFGLTSVGNFWPAIVDYTVFVCMCRFI